MIFSYIGPETMMPVASVFAVIAGLFMMAGRSVWGAGLYMVRRILRRLNGNVTSRRNDV